MKRDTWERNARTIPRDYKIHCLDSWPLLTSVSVLVLILNPLSSTMPLYDFAYFEGHTGENLYRSYCAKEVLLTSAFM